MIPDLRSSRGENTTSEIGFYPGNLAWSLENNMELNTSKTKEMVLSTSSTYDTCRHNRESKFI